MSGTLRAIRLSLGLLSVVSACANGGDGVGAPTPGSGNDNYGQERIGYKVAPSVDPVTGAASPSTGGATSSSSSGAGALSSAAPPSGDAFYGAAGAAYSEPVYAAGGAAGMGGMFAGGSAGAPVGDAGVPLEGSDAGAGAGSDAGPAGDAGDPISNLLSSLGLLSTAPDGPPPLENPYRMTGEMPASTFSIDVDSGSYTLSRASLRAGHLPDPQSVRIEEFINYFHFHYGQPKDGLPFSVYTEVSRCPWNADRQLLLIGIQGQEVPLEDQPPANLVYLVDVSGSMSAANKLPLLKSGFRMLTRQLRPQDRVSMVTYAGNDTVVIEGVSGADKATILSAIDNLESGGSTNGEGGIQRAYQIAQEHFIQGGNNRVLLATDGDFNVGLSGTEALSAFIATKRETGVFLSVYGFGDAWDGGNYQDVTAEQIADNGNGVYFYIDSPEEARRAFIHTVTGSLLTVAKDVKLQVQFNPGEVAAYRLIGYENRVLANSDFANDSVDAGELGAGLSVTALFELVGAGDGTAIPTPLPGTDPLEQTSPTAGGGADTGLSAVSGNDLVEVRIRYKGADATTSKLISERYTRASLTTEHPSLKFLFASAVSELAMQLRGSQYLPVRRTAALRDQIRMAHPADYQGAITEFQGVATDSHHLMAP